MPYAGFFRRAVAFIIDLIIVWVPTLFIFGPILAMQSLMIDPANPQALTVPQASILAATIMSWQIVLLVVAWLYFAFFESSSKQATWGKQLLKIKVVDADGQKITFARASGRLFAKILSYVTFYIGFIMAGFTNRKRALHDMIAETYVVKKDFQSGQELPPTKPLILWLIVVCVVWVALLLSGSWLSSRLTLTPTQQAAAIAANYLTELAQNDTVLNQPRRTEGVTYFHTPEGYRAVVTDPMSGNKFTLFLRRGSNQACCQAFPFGDCQETGIPACE